MKRFILKTILILFVVLLFQNCATGNKYLSSETSISDVSNLDYFEPYSYIQLIKKGNKAQLNDSLSIETKNKLDSIITFNKNLYKIKKKLNINDALVNKKIENELSSLIQTAIQKRKLKGIKLTPVIDSVLESKNQRFALGIVATGFGRRKGNYTGQSAKAVAVGVLTLGLFAPIPIKSNLSLYSIIVDSEKNEITFYKNTLPVEKSPDDPNVIKKQLDKLFQGYLTQKNKGQ
ncbi:hypothetical protein [Tenacibaculum sp. UWU-22]|uniref:hypothetical protein n=1 Tax=Tenacibaculum sp. UWU-22 TaxID=3234187 RepID=UPI0034DAC298